MAEEKKKPTLKSLEERIQKLENPSLKNPWKTFDRWIKIIAAIGSVGAFVSIFFLWSNFKEMQKQTEFENRGFLAITIDSFTLTMKPDGLPKGFIVYFRYHESSRVPVLIKQPRMVMASDQQEEDINKWIAWAIETPSGNLESTEVNIDGKTLTIPVAMILPVKKEIDEIVMHSKSEDVDFYLNVIFKYEDITGKNYWVYMRWNLIFHAIGVEGKVVKFRNMREISEEYLFWEANPDESVPDSLKLPKELKELTKKARKK